MEGKRWQTQLSRPPPILLTALAELRRMAARVEDRSTRADTSEAYLADMAQLDKIYVEIARREAVAAGDVSQMTPAERLRRASKSEAA